MEGSCGAQGTVLVPDNQDHQPLVGGEVAEVIVQGEEEGRNLLLRDEEIAVSI